MKARKIAGIRLINYINDGITWKSHKDIILDFWIMKKCQDYGYTPYQFRNMFRVVELPTEAQEKYQEWFEKYDFQNDTDKAWLDFVNGTLNLFYRTDNPKAEDDDCWYIDMMQSEVEARQIVTEQVYHGSPNLNAFWKISTDSKPEEVGGRRNGYIYVSKLGEVTPKDTDGYLCMNASAIRIMRRAMRRICGEDRVFHPAFDGHWGGEDSYLAYLAWAYRITMAYLPMGANAVKHMDHPRPEPEYGKGFKETLEAQVDNLRKYTVANPVTLDDITD